MAAIMAANFNLDHVDFVGPTYVFQERNDGYVLIIQACPMFFCFGARSATTIASVYANAWLIQRLAQTPLALLVTRA